LAEFLEERFRDEFRPVFEAWLALNPSENPDAPPTPFTMSEHVIAERIDADEAACWSWRWCSSSSGRDCC
jgi:hypothetical protein